MKVRSQPTPDLLNQKLWEVGPVTCVLITQLVRCTGMFENHCVQFSKHAAGEYHLGVSEPFRQHCIPIKSGSFGVGMRSQFCFQFSR